MGTSKHFDQMRLTQKMHDLNKAINHKKKLAKLAEKLYDSAIKQLQIESANSKTTKVEDRDSVIVRLQEASDRKDRASRLLNRSRLEMKNLEEKLVLVTKEAEKAGAKFPKLFSTWALNERKKMLKRPPENFKNASTANPTSKSKGPAIQEAFVAVNDAH